MGRRGSKYPANWRTLKPKPCPFCGAVPTVGPADPEREGNAGGFVRCENPTCPAQPYINDGETVADERGSAKYKALAIVRWNTRSPTPGEGMEGK